MPHTHRVQRGECLSAIAARYGFADYKALYDHPDNAALKAKRPNPNLLHPGDAIVIPDKEEKVADCATGQRHNFRVKMPTKKLHLRFLDEEGEPIASEPYELDVDGQIFEGVTSGDGEIEHDIPARAENARLALGERRYLVRIGDLNPFDDVEDSGVSAVQARLRNLGIDPGPVDGKMGPKTRHAIAAFQAAHGLAPTGECKGATLDKLKEVYGC